MRKHTSTRTLKYEILENVDYAYITRKGNQILEIPGKDLEKVKWRDFQKMVGQKVGAGLFGFTIKFKGSGELYSGTSKGVNFSDNKIPEDPSRYEEVIQEFKKLKSSLDNGINAGGITWDMLIASTKQGYEAQVSFLNQQISYKDTIISDLKQDLREAENDLQECEKEAKELQGSGSMMQYLGVAKDLLSARLGSPPPVNLKDSNPSDIPKEVLEVLGAIDWSRMNEEATMNIVNEIKKFLKFFPLKGAN